MSRLPRMSARPLRIAVVVLVIGLAVPAFAGSATPEPVLDSAPYAVWYRGDARIKGHLEGGTPGDEVTLERKKPGGNWNEHNSKPVDESGRVRFNVRDVRKTTLFRLAWTDEVTESTSYSEPNTVRVKPKLTMAIKPRHAYEGSSVLLKGRLLPKKDGRKVIVKRKVGGTWQRVKRVAAGDGDYKLRVPSGKTGHRRFKVRFEGDRFNRPRGTTNLLKVYSPDPATWYGPGFYGNGTACGKTLTRRTLGVAHRTLPCGTMVSIVFQGRTITVPVIDRGPYTSAEWDLTQETAERIGFSGTNTVGTLHE